MVTASLVIFGARGIGQTFAVSVVMIMSEPEVCAAPA